MLNFEVSKPHQSPTAAEICTRGEEWRSAKLAAFSGLPAGTTVMIELESGAFVTGKTWLEAHDAFKHRFGPAAFGYTFTVDRPLFIGGGICLR